MIGLPSPAYLPQYLACFAIGIVAARRRWIEGLQPRTGIAAGALALLTLPLGLALGLAAPTTPAGFVAALLQSAGAAGLMTELLVLFRNRVNVTNKVLGSAAANAFAVYLLHPVVLVWVAVLLSPLVAPLPALGRFAVLLVVGGGACWLAAATVRRLPAARRIL